MVDPYLVSQFKKVQARLDELRASQLRIEVALGDKRLSGLASDGADATNQVSSTTAKTSPDAMGLSNSTLTGDPGSPLLAPPFPAKNQVGTAASDPGPLPGSPCPVVKKYPSRRGYRAAFVGGGDNEPSPAREHPPGSVGYHRGKSCESLESYVSAFKVDPWPEFVWLGDESNRARLRAKQARALKSMTASWELMSPTEIDMDTTPASSAFDDYTSTGARSTSQQGFKSLREPHVSWISSTLKSRSWWRHRLLIYPHSKFRLLMDFIGMLSLAYDSVAVPVVLAWEDSYTDTVRNVAWATACFWTLDMLTNFVTSHYTERSVETRVRTVMFRYIKSWFLLDFAVVVCEWMSLILEIVSESQARGPLLLKFARLLKLGRILRFLAVLRVGRFAQGYEYILVVASRIIRPMYIEYGIRISKLVLLILWFNHVGSCLWHFLNISNDFTDIQGPDSESSNPWLASPPQDTPYLYSLGYYWSVTAMFSGATVTFPENTYENISSVGFIVFGIMFGSSLISTLASLMIEFQLSERENTDRMRTLRLFLQQHNVSVALSVAIQRQVLERMQAERRLSDQDVPALHLISTSMRADLRHALCEPLLMTNDVFRAVYDVDAKFMGELITSPAMVIQSHVPGEEIFPSGDLMNAARVVVFGQLRYSLYETNVPDAVRWNANTQVVRTHKWICEVALWCQWTSRGLLEVSAPSELLELNTIELGKVTRKSGLLAMLLRDISVWFCFALNQEQPDTLSDLDTGLHMDTVLFALPKHNAGVWPRTPDSRSILSYQVMSSLRRWHPLLRPWGISRVEEEVVEGVCMLRSDTPGWAMKVVQVIELHLKRDDETMCVKVQRKAGLQSSVCLPSTKVRLGELPRQAVERLLRKEMPELQMQIQHKGTTTLVSDRQAWAHKVRLRYITVQYFAKVLGRATTPGLEDSAHSNIMEPEVLAALLEGRGRRKPRFSNSSGAVSKENSVNSRRSESTGSRNVDGMNTKGRFGWMTAEMLEAHIQRRAGTSWESLSRVRDTSWASILDGLKAADAEEEDGEDDIGSNTAPSTLQEETQDHVIMDFTIRGVNSMTSNFSKASVTFSSAEFENEKESLAPMEV